MEIIVWVVLGLIFGMCLVRAIGEEDEPSAYDNYKKNGNKEVRKYKK